MSDLVVLDYKDYGLTENSANQIMEAFQPMLQTMAELEKEYNDIINLPITPENCKKAKELRLKYVKARTTTDKIHKEKKQFYLAGGRFVDGWKNAQYMASGNKEKNLKVRELYYENIEKEKKEKIRAEREKILISLEVDVIPAGLDKMEDETWNIYRAGAETSFNQKKEAERKAEEMRLEQERRESLERHRRNKTSKLAYFISDYNDIIFADLSEEAYMEIVNTAIEKRTAHEEEQEKIRVENERLKKEAEEKEAVRKKQEESRKKEEAEAERKRQIAERKRQIAERKRQEKEQKKLDEERKRAGALELELQKKKEEEEQQLKEAEEKRQAEFKKGDSEKFVDLLTDLKIILSKYKFNSAGYKSEFSDLSSCLEMFIKNNE